MPVSSNYSDPAGGHPTDPVGRGVLVHNVMPAKLRETTAALGLYKYGVQAVGGQAIAAFHAAFVESFASVGLTANYIAMDGDGYTGRSIRTGGSGHKKALATGFTGVNVLSLIVIPKGAMNLPTTASRVSP
jgi:hypothetical protein